VETPTGEVTGDGSTHPARCRRAGYQSEGLPRGLTKVLTQRSPEMTVSLQTYRMVWSILFPKGTDLLPKHIVFFSTDANFNEQLKW